MQMYEEISTLNRIRLNCRTSPRLKDSSATDECRSRAIDPQTLYTMAMVVAIR